ncbi:helix-turn-helix domain-containing protein [Halorubrum sp. ASP1]|uniref:helix-turn-helix domain-containing protein n=1 Tax=Halorubrum sp. ASP1 TaxID=2518114 RepID=UPI0010F9B998|nr:helix-turn-helix domain-containing protein [Halorubrum sp. ASP1]TKX62072.1 helix-turn-helix domain-containing protein [Halorubrum sp. ASP1]
MRAVTFTLGQPSGSHISSRMFGPDSEFERDRIYHLNILADETVVLLGRLRGDMDDAARLLSENADVLGHSISSEQGGSALVYVHAHPPPELKEFLKLPRTHEVFFDFPIGSTQDGRHRVVLIGETNQVIQEALADLPPTLDVSIERIGPYLEAGTPLPVQLTDRQREVLNVALDLGYYDVPRQVTHQDIADRLELSAGTVGEHLQKIESRVFEAFRS